MLVMFIFEDMRSSNITKRAKPVEDFEDEDQETLEEIKDGKSDGTN
jgi:hypothetical protein